MWLLLVALACVALGYGPMRVHPPGRGVDLDVVLGVGWRAEAPVTVDVRLLGAAERYVPAEGLSVPGRWQGAVALVRAEVQGALTSDVPPVNVDARGGVTIVIPDALRAGLKAGGRYRVVGAFSPVGPARNPGQADPRASARQAGRVGTIVVDGMDAVVALDGGRLDATGRAIAGWAMMQSSARRTLDALTLPGADDEAIESPTAGRARAMLRAMLLGQRDADLHQASGDLARLGIVHIVSISGFHLAVLAGLAMVMLRLAPLAARGRAIAAILAVGAYVLLVPAEAPVIRSAVMIIALLAAEASGRRYDRLSVLAWTSILLLVWRPLDVFSPGFQLSFLATGVLIARAETWAAWLGARITGSLPGVRGRRMTMVDDPDTFAAAIKRGTWGMIGASALAVTMSTPTVMVHTGIAPGWGVLLGIVLTPLATLALLIGLIALPLGAVWTGGAEVLAGAARWLCEVIFAVADATAHQPGVALYPGPPAWWWALGMTAALGWLLMRSTRGRWVMAMIVAACWPIGAMMAGTATPRATPRVDQLSLSGSTCALVTAPGESGRGERVLIDPGSMRNDRGREVLTAWYALTPRSVPIVRRIEPPVVVITGAGAERFNLLGELLAPLGVRRVVMNRDVMTLAEQRPLGPQSRLVAQLRTAGVEIDVFDPAERVQVGAIGITLGGKRITGPVGMPAGPMVVTSISPTVEVDGVSMMLPPPPNGRGVRWRRVWLTPAGTVPEGRGSRR
jgi:competence protein ComEC